jgi:hypothetical protein
MQEKIAVKNNASEYRETLIGTWETNPLSMAFFSKVIIHILQKGIRAGVYQRSQNQTVIPPQNVDVLKIIMRSTYLQYAEHRPTNIREQIARLNQLVLDYCVPTVFNETVGYAKYLEDISTMHVPMEIPRHHDRNYKQLVLKQWL